ncbi:MAG: lysoplasmalogenase [Verrucomicrobiales bacterium]|nr:lysoplasmalogenase [Verrucomicrobiales bacterium]
MKLAVPLSCAVIITAHQIQNQVSRATGWLVLAFLASLVGDAFLSTRAGRESFYLAGIAAFFVAHVGYLTFALRHGRLHKTALGILLLGYVGWFVIHLGRAIPSRALQVAALAYLLISCVTLAAACGLRLPALSRHAYLAGIALIVFSDSMIALNDFLKIKSVGFLILPTYYLAQVAVAAAVLILNSSDIKGRARPPGAPHGARDHAGARRSGRPTKPSK